MDDWGLPDLPALRLLGRTEGLTKSGNRPRFRLEGEAAAMLAGLREIGDALAAQGEAPGPWMLRKLGAAPFAGQTPLAFLERERLPGLAAVQRHLLAQSLRQSLRSATQTAGRGRR